MSEQRGHETAPTGSGAIAGAGGGGSAAAGAPVAAAGGVEVVDVSGLPLVFFLPPPSARGPRWLQLALPLVAVVAVLQGLLAHRYFFVGAWGVVLVLRVAAEVLARRAPLVRLNATGVAVRRGLRMRRWEWSQVADVAVQGRWDMTSALVLADGRRVVLPWVVSAQQAGVLQAALRMSRHQPADDDTAAGGPRGASGRVRQAGGGSAADAWRSGAGPAGPATGSTARSGGAGEVKDLEGPFRRGPRDSRGLR